MAKQIGKDAKLYYKVGGQDGGGAWLELLRVKEVTIPRGKGEADTSTRSSGGYETATAALKTLAIDFEIAWNPNDAGFEAVRAAYEDDLVIGFRALDKVSGEGPMGDFEIFDFVQNQPLQEELSASVSAKLTDAGTPPTWYGG